MKYIEIPISKLKEDYREVVKHCQDGQAVIITRYGKKHLILMTSNDYEKLLLEVQNAQLCTKHPTP